MILKSLFDILVAVYKPDQKALQPSQESSDNLHDQKLHVLHDSGTNGKQFFYID